MKIKKYLLHIGLLIAVVISLVFSAIIWIDPATFHRNTTQTTTTNESGNSADATVHYDLADVYSPTEIAITQNKQQTQLTSSKDNLISDLCKDLRKIKVQQITVQNDKDFNTYRKDLLENDNIILSYSNQVSIGLFEKLIGRSDIAKQYENQRFQHIVLPTANHREIYLLNDVNYKVYKLQLKTSIPAEVYRRVTAKDIQQTPIEYQEISKGHYIKNYPKGVTVPKYSYLINKENSSLFVTHLLGASSSNSIATKEHDGVTTYTTDNGQRLVINSKDGTVNYAREGRANEDKKVSFNDALKDGFDNLSHLGVSLDDVRYQNYDENHHQVTYQSYINGYPIISPNFYGTYEIGMQSNGATEYRFSVDDLQVPLPNNNQTVNLPPTSQVLQTLKSKNYNLGKVKSIIVGYQWTQNSGSQMVVDLTPTYFIRYNGNWINYQTLSQNH